MQKNNLVLLFGDNAFELEQKIKHWKQAFIEKYGSDLNVDEMQGSTPAHSIVEAAYAMPFLSEKRLVIVKNLFAEQKAEALKKIAEALDGIPESSVLIFIETTPPDKRTALFKKLKSIGRVEEMKPLSGDALIQWIIKSIHDKKGVIDPKTAVHLATTVGNDLMNLTHEIEKLIQYAAGEPMTEAMVDEIVSDGAITTSIFKLTDALGAKKTKDALKLLHKLVQRGEELTMIFGMMVRQFRLLIQIQDLKGLKCSANEIATRINQHPYAVNSILPQCKNFTPEELKTIYQKLLAIDRGLKTGEFRYQPSDQNEYLLQIEKLMIESAIF